jgi:hypothetical protein
VPDGVLPELEVSCGGSTHRIRWTPRGLDLLGHPGGREEDDVLVALSGEPASCRRIEAAWVALEPARALELLTATAVGAGSGDEVARRLAAIARRLPAAVDQRERVRRRDDLSDDERAVAIHGFDQMIALAEVAALGPVFARRRAVEAVDELWRGRRRRGRSALVAAAVQAAGASRATIVLLPTRRGPGVVVRVRGRAVGVVSRPWQLAA